MAEDWDQLAGPIALRSRRAYARCHATDDRVPETRSTVRQGWIVDVRGDRRHTLAGTPNFLGLRPRCKKMALGQTRSRWACYREAPGRTGETMPLMSQIHSAVPRLRSSVARLSAPAAAAEPSRTRRLHHAHRTSPTQLQLEPPRSTLPGLPAVCHRVHRRAAPGCSRVPCAGTVL